MAASVDRNTEYRLNEKLEGCIEAESVNGQLCSLDNFLSPAGEKV